MSQYRYSPLSPGRDSIRLLRLLPHEDETADIQCELFEYSLPNSCKRTHLYDSLSYVWGNPEEKLPIVIHKLRFDVTVNLRAALSRLRNHSVERILWIDAICIDQANQEEKEHQIQSMAKIYGQANRVVVWLGEAADDSDLAFEEIRIARGKKSANSLDSEKIQQAVLALLQRPWFRRIWILQEVAAARNVLIMCGFKKIDGYVFCLGVDSLKNFYEARPDLQGLIRSVTYLIREAIFRPGYSMGSSGRSSLDICPLGELMDMYHAHEATKRHDKVYALLGMSSDDLSEANLLPNYRDPWEELLQRLAKFLLSEKISVETWGDKEIAAIKSKGCILGKVSSVLIDTALDDRQSVDVIFKNISGQPGYMGVQRWTLRPSAKSIRDGDLICLLQGASKPAVIRLCKDHFAIIMIAATPLENIRVEEGYIEWPNLLQSAKTFTRDFLLFWDWENFPKKFQDPEEYEMLIRTNDWVSEHSEAHREDHLDKATRVWNVALILGDLEEYKEAEERLREAIEGYKIAFGVEHPYTLKSQYGLTPLSWAAGNGYDDVVHLLLAKDGVDPDLKDSQYGRTALSWAAEGGHEAVVKLLLETGKVEVDAKDSDGRTALSWVAKEGYEAVVKLLLETGKVEVDAKDSNGWTALSWAAKGGHEAVVRLLLETGKVEVDAKDSNGWTALSWAAKGGHEAVVRLLLEMGKVDVDAKGNEYDETALSNVWKVLFERGKADVDAKGRKYGGTALSLAAEGGHEAVVKLLLETGKFDVDAKDNDGRTALLLAAEEGHEAVVKLLLEMGKADVNTKDYGRTALLWAAEGGHEAVVKLLLETGKVDVYANCEYTVYTALSLAAEGGYEAVVRLLLEAGKVKVDAKDRRRLSSYYSRLARSRLTRWNGHDVEWVEWALTRAARNGHEEVVKLLLETGKTKVNARVDGGATALEWAAGSGQEAVVKLLLERVKVDVDVKDSDGRRAALSWAAKGGHEAVVKLLQSSIK